MNTLKKIFFYVLLPVTFILGFLLRGGGLDKKTAQVKVDDAVDAEKIKAQEALLQAERERIEKEKGRVLSKEELEDYLKKL
jgi:hypothetical protein